MNDLMIKSVWGEAPYSYSYQPLIKASGGLVTMWDASRVDVWSFMSFGYILIIKGKVIITAEEFVIFNVYAPCDSVGKKELWDRLNQLVLNNNGLCLCVCGDFNSVQSADERKGRGVVSWQANADMFNEFIHDSLLTDLLICGR
jgi:hypothetical protein